MPKVSDAMAVLPLHPQAHLKQFLTRVCMCGCACVCKRVRACVCFSHSENQQKSVSQSRNWRNLLTWDERRAATLVVIVFLMRVVPCRRAPISLYVDHVCVRVCLPICPCMPIATTYSRSHPSVS